MQTKLSGRKFGGKSDWNAKDLNVAVKRLVTVEKLDLNGPFYLPASPANPSPLTQQKMFQKT
jgi:hypothetical protein